MFIKRTKNSAGQTYYHLVESYRKNGKVHQRTLLSLGRAEDGKLEHLAAAVAKHTDLMSAVDLAKNISIKDSYILGPLLVLQRLFETLGINATLRKIKTQHPKLEIDFVKTVFTLVAARFIRPCSKLGIHDELLKKMYPAMVDADVGLHHIYRSIDLLARHKNDIETSLYWHGRDLLNMHTDVILYDLTTLRFESVREDVGTLRRFGYSKEMRSDCTQVVLGLLVDKENIPLGFEVYPGNTFEGHTLSNIVEKMRKKFKVNRFIFVSDRGLMSKKNVTTLKENKGEFIVGMRLGQMRQRRDEIYAHENFIKINENFSYYETQHNGDRCLITWSLDRAERDKKVRDDILLKLQEKLTKKNVTSKNFVSNSNYQKFLKGFENGGRPTLNEAAIEAASKQDGFFAILTNVADQTAVELLNSYKELWKIEDSFGELKGTLKARPIFHWTDDRIIGHLTMCFLAHLCEAHLAYALRISETMTETSANTERPLSAARSMRDLVDVRVIPVKLGINTLWVRTDITGHSSKIFSALSLRIPPKVLKISEM